MSQYDEIAPDVVSPHDSKSSPDQPLKHLDTVIALYDFPGTQPLHLPLNLGDTIFVLSKSATGWWDGVVIANNEIQRGWFPHNYVRLVNYVQPILNKLKLNKEIDLITAANTAANVLIPSFTNLLQRSLLEDKNSLGGTRKNSVVSFASEASTPREEIKDPIEQIKDTPPSPSSSSHSSNTQSLAYREGTSLSTTGGIPTSDIVDLDEAEAMAAAYKAENGLILTWVPRYTSTGNYIFYSEQLDVYCETPPFVDYDSGDLPDKLAVPSNEALDDDLVVRIRDANNDSTADSGEATFSIAESATDSDAPVGSPLSATEMLNANSLISTGSQVTQDNHPRGPGSLPENPETPDNPENHAQTQESLPHNPRSNSLFDPLKRDSSASFHTETSNLSYHHFSQPFFAMDNLFYKSPTDLTRWSDMQVLFIDLLDLSVKAVKEQNKQLFGTHFFRLNKLISVLFIATRLAHDDFVDSKYEKSVRRKLKRVAASFAQVYINGILHLSVMHRQTPGESQLFGFDVSRLGRSDTAETIGRASTSAKGSSSGMRNSASSVRDSLSSTPSIGTPNISTPSSRNASVSETFPDTYFDQIQLEIENMKQNVTLVIKIFVKLTAGKVVRRSDYDSLDNDEAGQDRHDILPQVYPRFIVDEFNGGNWCNPFFSTKNPVLNISGDDLKNRYHSKIIIDHQAYALVCHYTEEMTKLSKETLEYLDPDVQHLYFNESLKGERNTQILRLIYKYLYHASTMVDLIESFDFTVFCLIKRYEDLPAKTKEDVSSLSFDYPVVLEFFQYKQQFHDLILNIIMATQALTLEDPEVFKGLKEDDPLFYNRDVFKLPTEKASLLLTNILADQLNYKGDHISLNPDTLMARHINEGIQFFDVVLTIIQQLIDERETILNYATRVMHDDFNVQLLVMERNNTILSERLDEGPSYYPGNKKLTDVPWYLEGDDEYDLLLDLKGHIKGGTKEALIAHLTHHSSFDGGFNSAFLFSFASMLPLGEFVGLLINRFNIEAPEGLSFEEYNTWIVKKQTNIRLRVLYIMKLLIEKYWSELYYNEVILKRWLAFATSGNVQAISTGKHLSINLSKLLNGEKICLEKEPILPISKPPAPLLKSSIIKKLKLLDIDYVELARQLTIREYKLFSNITKFACLAKVWGKKSGINDTIEDISIFIKASNQLTNFVAYMILRKLDIRKRVQIIRYFVQVAEKCRQFNNFSSMTAIISALYSSPIHRLKKTWKYLNGDTMNQLQNMNKLMNLSRNFNEYRDVLKFIGLEPCVPFFGVYLSDLTFVYHGNPDFLMNRTRMINFAKRAKTFEIVSGIDRFMTMGFNFTLVPEIQKYVDSWFDKCPTIEEQYQLSLNLESRETVQPASSAAQNVAKAAHASALKAAARLPSKPKNSSTVSSTSSTQPHHSSSSTSLQGGGKKITTNLAQFAFK